MPSSSIGMGRVEKDRDRIDAEEHVGELTDGFRDFANRLMTPVEFRYE